jgi:hypothetical protein
LQPIHLLANRHRLATLIACGALLLAAAAPVAAHHPNADGPGREAFFSNTLDTAADEVDGWQGGEFNTSTDASSADGTSSNEQGTGNQDATDSNDGSSNDAEDANDNDSATGADFEHSGTSDHGRPHRAGGSDDMSGGQGSTSNG